MLPRHLTDPTAQRVTGDGTRCTVDIASDLRNASAGAAPSQTRATGADKATAKRRHGGVHTDAFPCLRRVSAMRPRWRRRLGHSEVILCQDRVQHGVQEVSATASADTVSETGTARRATRFTGLRHSQSDKPASSLRWLLRGRSGSSALVQRTRQPMPKPEECSRRPSTWCPSLSKTAPRWPGRRTRRLHLAMRGDSGPRGQALRSRSLHPDGL